MAPTLEYVVDFSVRCSTRLTHREQGVQSHTYPTAAPAMYLSKTIRKIMLIVQGANNIIGGRVVLFLTHVVHTMGLLLRKTLGASPPPVTRSRTLFVSIIQFCLRQILSLFPLNQPHSCGCMKTNRHLDLIRGPTIGPQTLMLMVCS